MSDKVPDLSLGAFFEENLLKGCEKSLNLVTMANKLAALPASRASMMQSKLFVPILYERAMVSGNTPTLGWPTSFVTSAPCHAIFS